jgi:hypothetical protein
MHSRAAHSNATPSPARTGSRSWTGAASGERLRQLLASGPQTSVRAKDCATAADAMLKTRTAPASFLRIGEPPVDSSNLIATSDRWRQPGDINTPPVAVYSIPSVLLPTRANSHAARRAAAACSASATTLSIHAPDTSSTGHTERVPATVRRITCSLRRAACAVTRVAISCWRRMATCLPPCVNLIAMLRPWQPGLHEPL